MPIFTSVASRQQQPWSSRRRSRRGRRRRRSSLLHQPSWPTSCPSHRRTPPQRASARPAPQPPTHHLAASKNSPRDKKAVLLRRSQPRRSIRRERRVRSSTASMHRARTSPTSASVRVWSGDCKRSAYARLRAPFADRRPPVHVEQTEVGEQRAGGIAQGSLDVPCRDRIRNDERQIDVGRREPADRPVPSLGLAAERTAGRARAAPTRLADRCRGPRARPDRPRRPRRALRPRRAATCGSGACPCAPPRRQGRRSSPERCRDLVPDRSGPPAPRAPRARRRGSRARPEAARPACGSPYTWPISNSATPSLRCDAL